ncbi:hypothetical protein [Bradyrhizobium sp. G127]|uniref:hypothetical protein n=1 Tax=Bradyrhizobium sp. G127 TaxID=2904800 RepID=UPI001F43B042|nr:hypothetical protein [Bradyrhizobium sp. G127]MCF2525413.1 hypothetical protein [Bradyrhizobium sp. G127]
MKQFALLAAMAAVLTGCGDDTASEARLTAAANLYGRTGDRGFELETYTSSPVSHGLTFTPKNGSAYGTFTVTEPQRCRFVYRWHHYNTVYDVNFNLLNMSAARVERARNPIFSLIIIPGVAGAFTEAGKPHSEFAITSFETNEAPIFLQRVVKFKEMCSGRA